MGHIGYGESVTTVAGETFTYEESCDLAFLIRKRFGGTTAGASAWRRLLGNTCTDGQFEDLADIGKLRRETLNGQRKEGK